MARNAANGGHASKERVAEEGRLAADNGGGGRSRPRFLRSSRMFVCSVGGMYMYRLRERRTCRDYVVEKGRCAIDNLTDGLPIHVSFWEWVYAKDMSF